MSGDHSFQEKIRESLLDHLRVLWSVLVEVDGVAFPSFWFWGFFDVAIPFGQPFEGEWFQFGFLLGGFGSVLGEFGSLLGGFGSVLLTGFGAGNGRGVVVACTCFYHD